MATKSRLQSQNFLASFITLIIMAIKSQDIDIDLTGDEIATGISSGNLEFILTAMIPAVSATIFKVTEAVKAGTFSFKAIIKSPNFITALVLFISGVLTTVGFILPEGAPVDIANAVETGSTISIITAVLLAVANPIFHFIQDWLNKRKEQNNQNNDTNA